MPQTPIKRDRAKSMREQLQEIINATTVHTATQGFKAIDELTKKGIEKLDELGLKEARPLAERAALELKKLIAMGITGRKQEPEQ